MSSGNSVFTARFFVICAFNFTVFLSGFMLFPTGPFHILDLGGNRFTAGLFLAFLTYASALSAPVTGALADRIGKRRVLIVSSLILVGISILYAVSPTYTILLALVPVHGFFWSGLLAASGAYLVDQIPSSRRAEGLAFWGLATVGAIAVAPPLAFWLYDSGGWLWVCIASSVFNLVMAGIAVNLREAPHRSADDSFEATFVEWRVVRVSITLFLFSFGYGGVTSFVALYAQASGTASRSIYFTVLAIVILVTRPLPGLVGRPHRPQKSLHSLSSAHGGGVSSPGTGRNASLAGELSGRVRHRLGLGASRLHRLHHAACIHRPARSGVRRYAGRLRHRHRDRLDGHGLCHRGH